MQNFRAALLATALAMAVGIPFFALSAHAQSAPTDQSLKPAQAPSEAAAKVPAEPSAKASAQVPSPGETEAAPANPQQDQAIAKTATPAQNPTQEPVQDHTQAQAQNGDQACPGNPNALGTSRVLPIDFSEYQQLGRMQYPDSLPLNDKEVVLTFDDGPLPPYTTEVLDILGAQCVKATFFMVGEMARAFPATVRQVYEAGHTIGTHSDHHPVGFGKLSLERMHQEIDGGIADVSAALGGDPKYLAPFFRIPGLERSAVLESELARRGLIIFSADVVADDWHRDITPDKIVSLALSRLEARGKGILLLHDIHPKTVAALPGLLAQLKEHGFHIVQVVPSDAYEIAMARKPATRMLVSAMPTELSIDNSEAVKPVWPSAADELTSDDVVLPVPDAAAFEPDAGLAADSETVHWPDAPEPILTASAPERFRGRHRRLAVTTERRKLHVARSVDHERIERERRPEHSRTHARTGAEGHRADLPARMRTVAALSAPARSWDTVLG